MIMIKSGIYFLHFLNQYFFFDWYLIIAYIYGIESDVLVHVDDMLWSKQSN